MKPPFAFYGGKVGMARLICSLMPPHRVYIEPFAGSLAVFFAKQQVTHEIVNDLDGAVVTFFRVLRESPIELERACRLTPYAREEYEGADIDEEGIPDLERARRFWIRVNQSFAKTAGSRTGWSVTSARTQSVGASVQGRIDRFRRCAERLALVSIERCDAADLVTRLATSPDCVVYADPPYVGSSRRSGKPDQRSRISEAGSAGAWSDYRFDMASEESHRRLAASLRATPATVILSGYPTPLYDELYEGWWSMDLAVTAHSSNAVATSRSTRVERLWSNREITQQESIFGGKQ